MNNTALDYAVEATQGGGPTQVPSRELQLVAAMGERKTGRQEEGRGRGRRRRRSSPGEP